MEMSMESQVQCGCAKWWYITVDSDGWDGAMKPWEGRDEDKYGS